MNQWGFFLRIKSGLLLSQASIVEVNPLTYVKNGISPEENDNTGVSVNTRGVEGRRPVSRWSNISQQATSNTNLNYMTHGGYSAVGTWNLSVIHRPLGQRKGSLLSGLKVTVFNSVVLDKLNGYKLVSRPDKTNDGVLEKESAKPIHDALNNRVSLSEPELNGSCNDADFPDRFSSFFKTVCKQGSYPVTHLLVANGADLNLAYKGSKTPLHIACDLERLDIAGLLIKHGAEINSQDASGWTPLQAACAQGASDCVKLLLDNNANMELTCNIGLTALHTASKRGFIEVARLLVNYGADLSKGSPDGFTALHSACFYGRLAMVRLLIDEGANIDQPSRTGDVPLHTACLKGFSDIVDFLVSHGADVNRHNERLFTALHFACRYNHLKVVRLLIENNADSSMQTDFGYTALSIACYHNWIDIVRYLLEQAPASIIDIKSSRGLTPLHSVCKAGNNIEMAQLLIEKGADVNATDNKNQTPLHRACEKKNSLGMVKLLVESGSSLKITTAAGHTPLHRACKEADSETVGWLLQQKDVNLNSRNSSGLSPLDTVSLNKDYEKLCLLIGAGESVGLLRAERQWTALHDACNAGYYQLAHQLLNEVVSVIDLIGAEEEWQDLLRVILDSWLFKFLPKKIVENNGLEQSLAVWGKSALSHISEPEYELLIRLVLGNCNAASIYQLLNTSCREVYYELLNPCRDVYYQMLQKIDLPVAKRNIDIIQQSLGEHFLSFESWKEFYSLKNQCRLVIQRMMMKSDNRLNHRTQIADSRSVTGLIDMLPEALKAYCRRVPVLVNVENWDNDPAELLNNLPWRVELALREAEWEHQKASSQYFDFPADNGSSGDESDPGTDIEEYW